MSGRNVLVNALLDGMLVKQRARNIKAAAKPCSYAIALRQATFLKGWSKGKPIVKFGDETTKFWKCGKWMTQIPPQEVYGMVAHGFAKLDGDILTLTAAASERKLSAVLRSMP